MKQRSWWLQEALSEDSALAPPLAGLQKADVCIVGGGFTGLWTAIRLKEEAPALDVAVVERDICGGGASGRNGGFVLSWWAKYLSMKKICGAEEAIRLCRLSAESVKEIGDFCRRHAIDAHYRYDGWLWAATCEAHVGSWNETVRDLERHQVYPFRELGREETQALAASHTHIGGVFEATAASVQPARLARGLRRVAEEMGVRLYERSPMTRLVRSTPPVVKTAQGEIRAEKVVLATNAWGIAFPEIRKAIAMIATDMIMTEPVPERLAEIGWTTGLTISDSKMLVPYYRNTLDGRVGFGVGGVNGKRAFGGFMGERFDGISEMPERIEAEFKALYPNLADVRVAASWMGPVDRSKSGLPLFGGLGGRTDILYGVGFSGNGVGPCNVAGKILASLVLERRDGYSQSGLTRPLERDFPPEPVRYIGTHFVRKAALAKDRADREGVPLGPLNRFLLRFAPSGLSPSKAGKSP